MLFESIAQLQEHGFKVNKTTDLQTVISHKEPFNIQGTAGLIAAQFNESVDSYTVTFDSMCSNGKVPNKISQTKTPLINHAISQYKLQEQQKQEAAELNQQDLAVQCEFKDVPVNQTFFLESAKERVYRKTSDTTFVNADSTKISSKFDMVAKPDRQVYMEQFDTSLTDEQKHQLVDALPPGLTPDEFHEQIGHMLEDVPGLESYSEEQLGQLHKQLFSIYRNTQ